MKVLTAIGLTSLLVLGTIQPGLSAPGLEATFGDKGLTSLQASGVDLLAPSSGTWLGIAGTDKKLSGISAPPTLSMEGKRQTAVYEMATVTTDYKNENGQLHFEVTFKNTSDQPLTQAQFSPFSLKFPKRPLGAPWFWGHTAKAEADGAPGVVNADWGSGQIVLSLSPEDASSANSLPVVELTGVEVGKNESQARFAATFNPPLAPGAEWKFRGALRGAPSGTPIWEVAKEDYDEFLKQFPPTLNWPDRHPIATVFLVREAQNWPQNPRGWFADETIDIRTPEGRQLLHDRLMQSADTTIAQMKLVGAQGALIWDLDGGERPHPFTYLGDPRSLPKHAPEMDEFADEYFKKFTDAGFKVGVCIRPSRVITRPDGQPDHQQSDDAIAEMSDKINYAQKRWGCTIFYMDTNCTWDIPNKPLSEDPSRGMWGPIGRRISSPDMVRLAKQHPDCLIFPEFGRPGYYSVAGVYAEAFTETKNFGTAPEIRAMYPDAMTVYKLGDADITVVYDRMLKSALAGDIYMFRGWFGDHLNPLLGHLQREMDYIKATKGRKPPADLAAALSSDKPEVRYLALKAIEKPSKAQIDAILSPVASETDWVAQRQMIRILGLSNDPRAIDVLVGLAKNQTAFQYAAACEALTHLGSPGTEALVLLLNDQQPRLPDAALRALASSKDPAATPALIGLTKTGTPAQQALAATALGARPSPESQAALLALFSSEDEKIVAAACTALGEQGDKSVIKPMIERMMEAVKKGQHDVRGAAGMALEKMTGLEYGPYEQAWKKALDEERI